MNWNAKEDIEVGRMQKDVLEGLFFVKSGKENHPVEFESDIKR